MSREFYLYSDDNITGPVDRRTLFYLAQEGDLLKSNLVRTGNGEWETADLIEGVFSWHIICPGCGKRCLAELDNVNTVCRCPVCDHEFRVEEPEFDVLDEMELNKEDEDSSPTQNTENFAVEDWTTESSNDPDAETMVCPHCWTEFPLNRIKYISRHYELQGDEIAGADEQQRFTPTEFTADGHALDARGLECADKTCPRCHLLIPESFIDYPALFYSIVGAPSSGKSYFLTSMIFRLRKVLSRYFDLTFNDASPTINAVLNEYEEKLFLNPEPDKITALPKTEMRGEAFSDQVKLNNIETDLPQPFIFTTQLTETHPHYEIEQGRLNENIVFYDNAGEHFQPGADSADNPATLHLKKSSGIIFMLDPSLDARMRKKCSSADPQLNYKEHVTPQQRLFSEMVERIRKYSHMAMNDKYPYPLIINVAKYDMWDTELSRDLRNRQPWQYDEEEMQYVLDMQRIMEVSFSVRQSLMDICPEIVETAESFAQQVYFVPTSALGTSPEEIGQKEDKNLFGVRPDDIDPIWVSVPALILLAYQGYIRVSEITSQQYKEAVPPEHYKVLKSKIMITVPGNNERLVLPLHYSGCSIYHRPTEQWMTIPDVAGSNHKITDADDFWDN